MKYVLGCAMVLLVILGAGCAVEPAGYYGDSGASVTVYGEYPQAQYGHYYGGRPEYYHHERYYHPYDRDHYYYRY